MTDSMESKNIKMTEKLAFFGVTYKDLCLSILKC